MRYIVEVPKKMAEKIASLVEQGKYSSFHEFIMVAMENQVFIESQEMGSDESARAITAFEKAKSAESVSSQTTFLESLKELRPDWKKPLRTIDPPNLEKLWSKFIWGQYNRILPTKITLRVLCNLQQDQEKLDLSTLQEKAANVASEVGAYLKRKDKQSKRKRWEALSIGLPNGQRALGGISRFKLQFVGYMTKQNILHGMPVALGFMNILSLPNQKISVVGITEAGARFSELANPIIDLNSLEQTLSDEEVAFYLEHVKSGQPYEMQSIKTVIDTINSGERTFDGIRNRLQVLDKSWSSSVLTTMCTGVLSRMRELRLLKIQKEGVRSHYSLGPNSRMVTMQ
jgi:Arc/MetJ-type ribon-helix-helix transcriptional regulator